MQIRAVSAKDPGTGGNQPGAWPTWKVDEMSVSVSRTKKLEALSRRCHQQIVSGDLGAEASAVLMDFRSDLDDALYGLENIEPTPQEIWSARLLVKMNEQDSVPTELWIIDLASKQTGVEGDVWPKPVARGRRWYWPW